MLQPRVISDHKILPGTEVLQVQKTFRLLRFYIYYSHLGLDDQCLGDSENCDKKQEVHVSMLGSLIKNVLAVSDFFHNFLYQISYVIINITTSSPHKKTSKRQTRGQ